MTAGQEHGEPGRQQQATWLTIADKSIRIVFPFTMGMQHTDPAGRVGSGTVDLGEVLSGESTSTVGTPATVGVDDDLAASETGITLGTTDDEAAGGLDLQGAIMSSRFSENIET